MSLLWLAIHCKNLPLDVFPALPSPKAITAAGSIVAGDTAAVALGVVVGMSVEDALWQLPALSLAERNPDVEAEALSLLACWAGRFTGRLRWQNDDQFCGLLLEVSHYQNEGGQLEALCRRILPELERQGFTVEVGLAPTSLAASWMARVLPGNLCLHRQALPTILDRLPLSLLSLSLQTVVAKVGLRTMGQLRCLPKSRIETGLGEEISALLNRAYGKTPDDGAEYVFPPDFSAQIKLPAIANGYLLSDKPVRRLVAALAGWLIVRQLIGVTCVLYLQQKNEKTIPLSLGLLSQGLFSVDDLPLQEGQVEPSLYAAIVERLATAQSWGRIDAITVEADPVVDQHSADLPLFDRVGEAEKTVFEAMREQWQGVNAALARLDSLQTTLQKILLSPSPSSLIDAVTDCSVTVATRSIKTILHACWKLFPAAVLFPVPQGLAVRKGRPHYRGLLRFLAGPIKMNSKLSITGEVMPPIVTGMSQPEPCQRDYYVALTGDGRWLWIYREPDNHWFLHAFIA